MIARFQRAALLTFITSLIFWAFFQLSKSVIFASVNPFAEDPVDVICSIAAQAACAISLLTLARAVQGSHTPITSAYKSRLIVRGNTVVLAAIALTLMADMSAELHHPT